LRKEEKFCLTSSHQIVTFFPPSKEKQKKSSNFFINLTLADACFKLGQIRLIRVTLIIRKLLTETLHF
jgi:hypothetical protein